MESDYQFPVSGGKTTWFRSPDVFCECGAKNIHCKCGAECVLGGYKHGDNDRSVWIYHCTDPECGHSFLKDAYDVLGIWLLVPEGIVAVSKGPDRVNPVKITHPTKDIYGWVHKCPDCGKVFVANTSEASLIDCVRQDSEDLEKIQKALDLLIGHNIIGPVDIFYRGKKFNVRKD